MWSPANTILVHEVARHSGMMASDSRAYRCVCVFACVYVCVGNSYSNLISPDHPKPTLLSNQKLLVSL